MVNPIFVQPISMMIRPSVLLFVSLAPIWVVAAEPATEVPLTPAFRLEQTVASYRGKLRNDYLSFPALLRTGENEILLSYKRGYAHAFDPGATLEFIRYDLKTGETLQGPTRIGMVDRVMQMGEWIRFPNGTIGIFIDAHRINDKREHIRIGLRYALSTDNGRTFGPLRSMGVVDGVEYGYLFDSVTTGQRLYALNMTFEYLAGGRRSVDAMYTDDNGKTWHFINNLSKEFGDVRINESSLIEYQGGFIVATRGYDNQQRLHQVDNQFKLIHQTNLTKITPSIAVHLGRPRLFRIEDQLFLIGRNLRRSGNRIELGLMRIDPETLTVEKQWVLNNIEQDKVTDGYYPFPLLVEDGDRTLLNVFDYKALNGHSPDIIRLQFDCAEFVK